MNHEIKNIKIGDFEMPIKYVTKIEMNVDTEKPPTFKIMLEVPFSRDLLKDFIWFEWKD